MNPAEQLRASVGEYLAQGGLVTALDYAGNVKGFHNGDAGPVVVVEPGLGGILRAKDEHRQVVAGPAREPLDRPRITAVAAPARHPMPPVPPAVQLPEPVVTLRTEPRVDVAFELRAIRLAARQALARLNRAFPQETP